MVEPLDLVQVRHDQRRTAALLGQCSNLNTKGNYGGRHSYLPINYWGKPRNAKPAPKPNVSFIRTVLRDDPISLPTIENKVPERNSKSQTNFPLSNKSSDNGLSLPQVLRKRDLRLLEKGIPMSRSLPASQIEKRYSPGGSVILGTERLPHICEGASEINVPDYKAAWRHEDNVNDGQLNKKFSEKLTVHVPGQDGFHGHSTVQKLSSYGEVLPPLVSIHSSISSMNPNLPDNNHFPYHHTKSNERPNLPHSDSTLPYHIRSVGNTIRSININEDSPLNTFGGISAQNSLSPGLFKSKPSSIASRRNSQLAGQQIDMMASDHDIYNGVDIDFSIGDVAVCPVYSDISSSVGSLLGINVSSNRSESFEGNLDQIDPLVQDTPKPSPGPTEEVPLLANLTCVRAQKAQKRKPRKVLEKGINIHRRAYLAALSVARSRQLPNDSSHLGKRISGPFKFSYFEHIPHQRPCRCVECRERMVTNAIVPKKNKLKKLSPIKSIFGSVKVEDYYFGASLVGD